MLVQVSNVPFCLTGEPMWQSGKSVKSGATQTDTDAPVPRCLLLGKLLNFSVFWFLHTPSVGNILRS